LTLKVATEIFHVNDVGGRDTEDLLQYQYVELGVFHYDREITEVNILQLI